MWSWCLFTAIETLTKAEVGPRDWGTAVIGLTILLFGGVWTLGVWVSKAMQWFKHYMGHSIKNIKDSGAKSDLNCVGLGQEVSENFSTLPRNCYCDILVKNMAAFCPYLRILHES